jgi:SAM-dependent methyltransferase
MRQNTPELWDELWEKPLSREEDAFALAKEEHSIRWRRIEKAALEAFGTLQGRSVIELGAGSGTCAALMQKRGAEVTILDYSDKALERAREFFGRGGLHADFVNENALALPESLQNRFDVAMSFGLAEHFHDANRTQIIRAHLQALKPGGILFISVPNKYCPPYRLFKFAAQRTGKWIYGEEYPFSHGELLRLGKAVGATDCRVFGSALGASFDFINPFKALAVVRNLFRLKDDTNIEHLRDERGTPLDSRWSYALVLCARRKA